MVKYSTKEMYKHLQRSYSELLELNEPNEGNHVKSTDETRYRAFNFFTRVYHLKDWLKKDQSLSVSQIEQYINNSEPLSLAADYCHANKHAGLSREPRSGKSVGQLNTHTKVDFLPTGTFFESKQEVRFDDKGYDIFELASECLKEWEKFFEENDIDIESLT